MKRLLQKFIYTAVLLLFCGKVFAQRPAAGTVAFTTPPAVNQTSATGVVTYVPTGTSLANGGQGLEFVIEGTAAANLQILSDATNSNNLTFSRTATQTIQRVRVRSAANTSVSSTSTTLNTPGWQFDIGSIKIALINAVTVSTPLTIQGFKNGVLAGTQTLTFTAASSTLFQPVAFTTAFDDVDDIVITGSMGNGIRIDDITISPTVNYSTPQNYVVGTAIASLAPNSNGGTVGYTVSPTLPGGLTIAAGTGIITGTPTTVTAATNYTVTGTYTGGTSVSVIRISVVPVAPVAPVDINAAANTIPENSAIGTVVGLTAYSSTSLAATTNLALNKPATATSYENATTLAAGFAVDGDATGSRWGSSFANDQDFTVDLGAVYDVSRIKITWEGAYGTDYQLQVSTDNSTFTTIRNIHGNTTLVNDLTNLSSSSSFGRYIRMHGIDRATQYGFSIYEFEVYTSTITYSFTAGGNPGSLFAINATTGVVTVANAAIDYEAGTTRTVVIQASDGTNTSSQSFVIAITDVNEAPDITSDGGAATATVPVAEGSTAVTTVAATDPDAGQTLAYSVSGTNASLFTINSSTGVLVFSSAAVTGTYTIIVTATDNGSPVKNVTQTLTVSVSGGSLTGYAYHLPITLQTVNVSGVTGNLNNFPVLVKIVNTALIYTDGACTNKVQFPNGPIYDFAFTNATGTELNYQLESYDKVTGTLIAWVNVPTINYQSNTVIAFYFGKVIAPTNHTNFAQNTWATATNTSASYKGVWHFNEAPSTTTATMLDATTGGNTLTASAATVVQTTAGLVQNGVTLGGGTLAKTGATSFTALNAAITMSAWVNYATYPAASANVFVLQNGTGYTQLAFRGTANSAPSANASGGGIIVSSTGQPSINTWHYLVYTFDGTTNTIYVDGMASTSTTAPNAATPTSAIFGSYQPGGVENYTGTIDEARTINVAMTNGWVQMEYKNQLNPTAFCSVSTLATDVTYVTDIPGGVVYTTSNAVTFTPNVSGVSTNPSFNGRESFIVTGNVTIGGNVSVYGLTINSGVTINLNSFTISAGCNIANNGTIAYGGNNASTIQFVGSQPQTYTAGAPANTTTVGTLVINNTAASTVTLAGGPFSVYNLVTMTSGTLASNGFLTLKSLPGATANVAPITTGAITGNVNVERYVTGGSNLYRGYRVFSSPVYDAAGTNNVASLAYLKNTAYITGTSTTGGFDNTTATANPTIYLYRENTAPVNTTFITGNFRGVNKINNTTIYNIGVDNDGTSFNLYAGTGYMFFFRGDRVLNTTPTVTSSAAPAATFTMIGVLNQGPITVKNWYTPGVSLLYTTATANTLIRGFNLVGNPYASAIDWDKFTSAPTNIPHSTTVSNTIYRYNVKVKQYSVYMAGNGGVATNFAANQANIIQSGEGFYVRATAASPAPTLGFTEAAKVTTQVATGNTLLATSLPANDVPLQYMRLKLVKDSLNTDDALFFFKDGAKTDFVADEDASYLLGSSGVSISSKSTDNINLAINRVELPKKTLTIPLNTNATTSGLYHINLTEVTNIPLLYDVWLMDSYKKDSLDMRRYAEYNFNIDLNNSATFGSNRFSLVIRQNPAYALKLLDFKAEKATSGAQLSWITENESNYTNFTIERSVDNGKSFEVIGGFASTNLGKYNLLDPAPVLGVNQYRLKQDDLNGTITYSKIISLMYSKEADAVISNNMSVFPNPTVDVVNVAVTPQEGAASYLIRITDGIGTLVKSATSTQPTWKDNVGNLKPGTYFVQVINNSTKAVVGTGKFIKK